MDKKDINNTSSSAPIQWYPGHMTKTRRQIEASLKLIDAVAEIVDARIPLSSRNPDLDEITHSKPRIVLLNKCDYADKKLTDEWIRFFEREGCIAIPVDCKSGTGLDKFVPSVDKLLAEQKAKWQAKGMGGRTMRVMVCGIPNVGKSSFINKMARNTKAKVEDRPGVTRGNQWFSIGGKLEILDTPGVLWPKFEDQKVAQKLAFTGAIRDNVIDIEELAVNLIELLRRSHPELLDARYKIATAEYDDAYDILCAIGRKRGMLISGGEIDTERAAIMLLDEFRAAKIGRITLETPERI